MQNVHAASTLYAMAKNDKTIKQWPHRKDTCLPTPLRLALPACRGLVALWAAMCTFTVLAGPQHQLAMDRLMHVAILLRFNLAL